MSVVEWITMVYSYNEMLHTTEKESTTIIHVNIDEPQK